MSNPGAPCPEIATYQLSSGRRAPKWLAVYIHMGDRLPGAFEGRTKLQACEAARDWWASEQRLIAKARVARGEIAA